MIRALDAVSPHHIVRGQYTTDPAHPEAAAGYRDEVATRRSTTESYIALKAHISNWRWAGTPFYLRTGKAAGGALLGDQRDVQGRAAFDLWRRCGAACQHPDDPAATERGDHPARDDQGAGPGGDGG